MHSDRYKYKVVSTYIISNISLVLSIEAIIDANEQYEVIQLTSTMIENFKIETDASKSVKRRKEILVDGYFYDVTDFIKRHPGGTVIEYYTNGGEDATHAIQQFHHRSIQRVKNIMEVFKKRPASDSEIGLDAEVLKKNRALTEDFTKLHLELEKEGIFEASYTHSFLRVMEIILLFSFAITLLRSQNFLPILIGNVVFGLAEARTAYLTHELGHLSWSGNPKLDRIVHSVIAAFVSGLSASRWRRQHNRHHAMPQRLHNDVDLETMPLLAFNVKAVKNAKDGKTFIIRNQAYLFLLIDTLLVGFIWQIYQDPKFMLKRKNYLEIALTIVHWFLMWFTVGFWPYVLSRWVSNIFLFGNFSLNHTHLPVTTEPTHWVEYSLLHTSDVEHSAWCSWVMGYLNYQIEHHLFPTIPHFRLHLIKDRVKALAEKHNIPYIINSYPEACRITFKNLSNVAKELNGA